MLIFLDNNYARAASALDTADLTKAIQDGTSALTRAYYLSGAPNHPDLKYEDYSEESKIEQLARWAVKSRQNYLWLNAFLGAATNIYRIRKEKEPSQSIMAARRVQRMQLPQNLQDYGLYPFPELISVHPFPPNENGRRAWYWTRLIGKVRKDKGTKSVSDLYTGDMTPDWPAAKDLSANVRGRMSEDKPENKKGLVEQFTELAKGKPTPETDE